jgi:hypothetical protein
MHETSDTLHLSLWGDFDGSSALELINILKANWRRTDRISINTGSLSAIHPFGRQVFNHNFSKLKDHQNDVSFIGKNADQITSS